MSELMTQKYFDAKPESVGMAREFTTDTLADWGLEVPVDDIRLCVSELACNALVHGTEPGHGFLVKLTSEDDFVRLEVHDSRSPRRGGLRPHVRYPDAADSSGRGLLIVEMLADTWGIEPRHPFGKIVWSRFKAVAAIKEAAC